MNSQNETIDIKEIANDIIDAAVQCRNYNISSVFISGIIYSSKVDYSLIDSLNQLLYEECIKFGFTFVNNGAVSQNNLWKDGIHLLQSGRQIVANILINKINNFLHAVDHPIWEW